jgi:GNAT superfamily N-acetyltransferase
VKPVEFPRGYHVESLRREHPRRAFRCGEPSVDGWLASKALQQHNKHLSVTRILLDPQGAIAGYYTLATGQVDFCDLPAEATKSLPRRLLPVAVLAWFGISLAHQGQGLGSRLFARALRDCHEAGKTFAFVAIILDCLNETARKFYQRWDFAELPEEPQRLFLTAKQLELLMEKL